MARDFLPLGRLILAASIIKAADDAHAKSLAFSILNFQVFVPELFPLPNSDSG